MGKVVLLSQDARQICARVSTAFSAGQPAGLCRGPQPVSQGRPLALSGPVPRLAFGSTESTWTKMTLSTRSLRLCSRGRLTLRVTSEASMVAMPPVVNVSASLCQPKYLNFNSPVRQLTTGCILCNHGNPAVASCSSESMRKQVTLCTLNSLPWQRIFWSLRACVSDSTAPPPRFRPGGVFMLSFWLPTSTCSNRRWPCHS